jgi:hypothetical protein
MQRQRQAWVERTVRGAALVGTLLGVTGCPADDVDDEVDEAVEELRDETMDAKDEIEDEIDDHS